MQAENGGNASLVNPMAHHRRIAPCPDGQAQCIEKNRLTSPRFTRQGREASRPVQLKLINEDNVTNGQGQEHGLLLENRLPCFRQP